MNSKVRSRFLAAATLVLLLDSAAHAVQLNAVLSGPVFGYLFDSNAGKIRPVRGALGSATVGAPVELGFTLSQALMLDATHLVASSDSSPELLSLNMEASPISITVISGVPATPLLSAASLQGTSAVFYYPGRQVLQVVSGLPERPVASHVVDLSRLRGPLTHMAVSNDGGLLVYSVEEGQGETLYSWTVSSENTRFLMDAGSIGGMVITGSGNAIVADRATNEVFGIWDAGGMAARRFLAGMREDISNPAGVTVSGRNRIYIANAGSNTVVVLDADGNYLRTHSCNCDLSGMYPFRNSVFRLTDRIDRSIFLLDASSDEEPILFVPAPEVSK